MFEIDENGGLGINLPECRETPEYNVLIRRDKGGMIPGDHEGRRKYVAFAELLYIYLVHHPKSIYIDLPEKERKYKAHKHTKLPESWKPDDKVAAAEARFIEDLELSALHKAYISAKRAVYSIGSDIEMFNVEKEKVRKQLTITQHKLAAINPNTDEKVEEYTKLYKKESELTNRLMTMSNNIQSIVEGLPKNYQTVKDLKLALADEQSGKQAIRGGGKLGRREE